MAFGARDVTLIVKILADASKAQQGLKDTAKSTKSAGDVIQGLAGPATIALGAVTLFGATSVDAASDVEQSFGALESVFKDQAGAAKDLATQASTANGLASSEYAQMAATLGAQLKNMGAASDDLVGQTDSLIDLGSDLSAQFGGSTADAVAALSSLLRGERDPIERYGVSIKQASLDAWEAAHGLEGLTGQAKTNADAQATLAILTQQTADAQGAFARESDTAAHAQQVANASWQDAQAALGQALLPALVFVSDALTAFSGFVKDNKEVVLALVVVIGTVSAAILALNVAMKVAKAVQTALTAAQWLLNTAMSANPIGLVVIAIMALVAAFVIAYNKSETFRRIVDAVFKAVMDVVKQAVDFIVRLFSTLAGVLAGPFETFKSVVTGVFSVLGGIIKGFSDFVGGIFGAIKSAINTIKSGIAAVKRAIDALPDLPKMPWDNSRSAPAGRGVPIPAAPGLRALAPRAAGTAQSAGVRVPMVLLLDREVFGRATVSSLRRYDRRNGPAQVLPRWS